MMRLRMLGLALVAVFALSAVAVASASAAEPEFIFTGAKAFTSESGPGKLEVKGIPAPVECKTDADTGEIKGASGSKLVTKVAVSFKGCTSLLGECKSGKVAEEIKTTKLEGTLEYLKATEPKIVGLDLWANGRTATEKANGEFHQILAEFKCGETEIKVRGSVIAEMSPIKTKVGPGQATTHFTLTYKQAGGVQNWTESEVEGKKVTDVLETEIVGVTSGFVQSGEETTDEVFPEAVTEIKA